MDLHDTSLDFVCQAKQVRAMDTTAVLKVGIQSCTILGEFLELTRRTDMIPTLINRLIANFVRELILALRRSTTGKPAQMKSVITENTDDPSSAYPVQVLIYSSNSIRKEKTKFR